MTSAPNILRTFNRMFLDTGPVEWNADPGWYVQNKWDGNTHTHTKERVGSVAANSDNLGGNKEAGGAAQGAQGSSKICTSRESVYPLSRLIRGFRNKYH